MITQLIEFDVKKDSHVKITAKEGDINSRNLEFRLLDNSLPFSLVGRTVRCYMVKPDKRIIFNDLQILDAEDGRCVLTLSLQSLIVSGMAKLELIIYEADEKLSLIPIKMDIIKSLNSDKLLESTNEFGALNNALWKIDTLENRMNNFVTLPEQSVTSVGDAELVDGRLGADGVTYNNIGNAIRGQMNKKQNAILEYDTISINLEKGLYNNVTTAVNTTKSEWGHIKLVIEKDTNYKISCRGVNGEYASIVGIDSKGGRHDILIGNNKYVNDYFLKSIDIEDYVSLVINTSDINTSPIIVKKGKQIDIIKYIDDKIEPLSNNKTDKKTMLCNLKGNSCKIRFKYSKTKDCIILFTDYVNNCFKLSHIYLINNATNEIIWDFTGRDNTTQYAFINSEWISPYKNLNAVNNPITSVRDQWTGGSHAIGSVKTNNIKSVKAYCDGVEIGQNIDTKCKEIKLVCTTEVSGSNTTATTFENNRYVLREIQEWTITPNTFDVNVKFEFLEDCTLGTNYGLQTENKGFTKLRHYGDSSNLGLVNMTAYAYGCNKTVGIANGWCLKDNNGNTLEVLVDTTYKCGNRCLLKADTPTIVTASYGKTYSYIVSEASFKAGDIVEHRGKYKFYYAN